MAQTVIITGATNGLGLATARLLARAGWSVVATGRDLSRITAADRAAGITPVRLDLGSLAAVRSFADTWDDLGLGAPAAIIGNAGGQYTERRWSEDGFELTVAVNHLAHVALIDAFLARLAPGSRVVLIGSGTHDPDEVPFSAPFEEATLEELVHPDEPGGTRDGFRRYATSKLCTVRTLPVLAERLADAGITVNAFDPGLMPATGLVRDYTPMQRRLWTLARPVILLAPRTHRVATSAKRLAALVADARYAGMSGAYVAGRRPIGMSVAAQDLEARRRMLDDSVALVGATNIPMALDPAAVRA